MSKNTVQKGISLSSYSKDEWEILLKATAYRGFKINKIAKRFTARGGECTFENDSLINLMSNTGKMTSVDMNKVMKKQDRWSFARLVHNIKMLCPNSSYATKFNDRISKLAEILTTDARTKDFHNRIQDNLGDFVALPKDIHDQIIYAMPTGTIVDLLECIDHMKLFWKAPLGNETICGTIDIKKFANWINHNHNINVFRLNLSNTDLKALLPYLEKLDLNSEYFDFDCFDLIETCKNLKALKIDCSEDFIDDHFQYIGKLSKLTSLNIYQCPNFSDEGLKLITGLNHLNKLYLNDCKITDKGLESINKLVNLTHLSFFRINFTEAESLNYLTKLSKLEHLYWDNANLSREGFKHLEKFQSLKVIYLDGGSLKDEDFESIGKLKNLTRIDIGDNNMTGEGLKYLSALTNLKYLTLRSFNDKINDNIKYIAQIKNLNFVDAYYCTKLTLKSIRNLPESIKWRRPYAARLC